MTKPELLQVLHTKYALNMYRTIFLPSNSINWILRSSHHGISILSMFPRTFLTYSMCGTVFTDFIVRSKSFKPLSVRISMHPLGLNMYISLLVIRCGTRRKSGFNIKGICGTDYSLVSNCIPVQSELSTLYAQVFTLALIVSTFYH